MFLMAAPFLEAARYRACASRRACIRCRSLQGNCHSQECQNSGRHDQSIMLGVAAYRGLQNLAETLSRTSHAHNCGIDYEAVELTKEICRAQHGPPHHKLID